MHCESCIGQREAPIDPHAPLGASVRPGGDNLLDRRLGRQSLVGEELALEDGPFDLLHVEPTAMLGREVPLDPFSQRPGVLRRKGLIQGAGGVDVEVVQHQPHAGRIRVVLGEQRLDDVGKLATGAPCVDLDDAPAGLWLEGTEQHTTAGAAILVILFGEIARSGRDGSCVSAVRASPYSSKHSVGIVGS